MSKNFGFLLAILKSRKFWILFFAALAAVGLPVPQEVKELIVWLAIAWAGFTALEDAAAKMRMTGEAWQQWMSEKTTRMRR